MGIRSGVHGGYTDASSRFNKVSKKRFPRTPSGYLSSGQPSPLRTGLVSVPLLRAWVHFPRAPEQFVVSPLCLVGYAR